MQENDAHFRPPQLGRLLERLEIAEWIPRISRPLVLRNAAACITEAKARFLADGGAGREPEAEAKTKAAPLDEAELCALIVRACAALERKKILPVLNATGVLLHTNLGRSPLGQTWEAVREANEGYSSVEFDLETGARGPRGGLVALLAAELAGSEAALATNNNAAAILLALTALAAGKEVIVSRGEQVQIGGGFRIPDILSLSGAALVEVGTTNVTLVEDYLAALSPRTAAVLVVHRSNFAIRGFAQSPSLAALAAALPEETLLIVDQGSGCYEKCLPGETTVAKAIRDGADLVCFSGDKLLGGPQAGIAVGKRELVARLAKHPLARALRPGKTVLSLLEERLIRALNGEGGAPAIPEAAELEAFGHRVMRRLPAGVLSLRPSRGASGGGSSPDESFPSRALEVGADAARAAGGGERLVARLREGRPPIVASVRDGVVRLDLAALRMADPGLVASLVAAALGIRTRATRSAKVPNASPRSDADDRSHDQQGADPRSATDARSANAQNDTPRSASDARSAKAHSADPRSANAHPAGRAAKKPAAGG